MVRRTQEGGTVTVATHRTTSIKTISALDRQLNTQSGNPRWRITFTDGYTTTSKPDSAVAHTLDNSEMIGTTLVCTFEDGRLAYARPAMSDVHSSPFARMREVRAANEAAGETFFDGAAVEFFDSQVETELIRGRLFVTSEQWRPTPEGRDHGLTDGERRYTLRYAMDDGSIETVGRFQQYAGIGEAVTAALEFGA
jgi:hypothetical protein